MSTRRARIKAVASLPIRRKNTGAADKTKQASKDGSEKTKSPRTPRAIKSQEDEKKSPYIKTASPSPKPRSLVSTISDNKSDSDKAHELDSVDDSYTGRITPLRVEKVSVITPNINYKHTSSPRTKSSFASPCVPSPKASRNAGVIVQRTTTEGKTPAKHTIVENNELQISSRNINAVVYNSASSKSIASDDYHVPSVPDSADNDGVMDGIVPLQAEANMPKPIDVLKSEIISENAEVLFDPIIPLPSPSKVRPKLRPAPRLGPHRRSSVQGSASESEDENRRALNGGANTPVLGRQRHDSHSMPNRATSRPRNDSVCSTVSQQPSQANASSPLKERNLTSMRRQVSRRMAAARRRRETLKRDNLTMYDLIFYNPITNPIVPNPDEIKAKEQSLKDEAERVKQLEEKRAEKEQEPESAAPVPQIKLGPNGEIILDKSSLVIKQTDSGREVSSVVREGAWGAGGGRYTRASRTAEWSASETVRFYRALAALGTDFSLMASLFPGRTRRDLKLKFKKEEKLNGGQVDKALRSATSWDVSRLKEEFAEERAEAARTAQRDAERARADKRAEQERLKKLREMRVRNSRASKALENTMLPGVSNQKPGEIITADDIIDRSLRSRAKQRQSSHPQDASKNLRDLPKTPQFATLTLLNGQKLDKDGHETMPNGDSMATLSRVTTPGTSNSNISTSANSNTLPNVPSNIESGSLVVLTVNDPSSPAKKMLQTYIAHRAGRLTPVSLPPDFLNSVVGYMKKGTPKSTVSSGSSPQLTSPSSVISQDSPNKRQRMSSYTITQL